MDMERSTTKQLPVLTRQAMVDDIVDCHNGDCRPCCFSIYGFFGLCAAIFIIVIMSMSIERVDAKHYAVAYSPITGKLENDVLDEGLHVKPAFGSFILWPQTYADRSETVDCNSEDGVRIRLVVNFQYLPREKDIYELTKIYEDDAGYKSVLTKHARSAIRNACAAYTTQEFQTQRAQVQTEIYDRLLYRLDSWMKTDVIDVQLANIERPGEYEAEVDDKESARNDIEQAENERTQALTQANTILLQAYTAANRTIDTANTDASNALTKARADADIITERYNALTESYIAARTRLGLDGSALLDYVKIRLVADMQQGTNVVLDPPTAST